MTDKPEFTEGQIIEVVYPFVRDTYGYMEEDGPVTMNSWKPGVRYEMTAPDDGGAFCDGEGKMILTVIAICKPGRYPTRVFFTRKFIPPNGAPFGKNDLRMVGIEKFRRISRRYGVYYDVAKETES
jgi:hypothetical protein